MLADEVAAAGQGGQPLEAADLNKLGCGIIRLRRVIASLRAAGSWNNALADGAAESATGTGTLLVMESVRRSSIERMQHHIPDGSPLHEDFNVEEIWEQLACLNADLDAAEADVIYVLERCKSPTLKEQTWVRRTIRNTALLLGVSFLSKHSRLAGSRDLENWGKHVYGSSYNFMQEHLLQPARQVLSELQRTFKPSKEVSLVSLEESRAVLHRMLLDFDRQDSGMDGEATGTSQADIEARLLSSMELVVRRFESDAKSPVKSLLTGKLTEPLMIQVQSIKVQVESALVQMNQVLKANKINFAIMTAVPFFVLAGVVFSAARRLLRLLGTSPAEAAAQKREMQVYMRVLLVEAERSILTSEDVDSTNPSMELGMQVQPCHFLFLNAITGLPLSQFLLVKQCGTHTHTHTHTHTCPPSLPSWIIRSWQG